MSGRTAMSNAAKILLLLSLLCLGYGLYAYYYMPEVRLIEQQSYLGVVDRADSVEINAVNVTLSQMPLKLVIKPANGFLLNATLRIDVDAQGASVRAYSVLPLKKAGDNVWVLPVTGNAVEVEVYVSFERPPQAGARIPLTATVHSAGMKEPVSATAYIIC